MGFNPALMTSTSHTVLLLAIKTCSKTQPYVVYDMLSKTHVYIRTRINV